MATFYPIFDIGDPTFAFMRLAPMSSAKAYLPIFDVGDPDIDFMDFFVNTGTTIHLPLVVLYDPDIAMFDQRPFDPTVRLYRPTTQIWFWAMPTGPAITGTEAAVDPITHVPFTRTFLPTFFIVDGKTLDFVGNPLFGRAILHVQFTDLGPPIIDGWFWTFGDGGFSTLQHPTHNYVRPGIYDVRLEVRIGGAWYTVFKKGYIVVWAGGLKVAETNRTLSFAVEPAQGQFWREFGGPGWVQPESIVGTFEVATDDDQAITCVTDARTGITYRLATRDGPAGSGVVRRFVDMYGIYGGGIEIPWTMRFKEHTAPEEHELIKHLLSYFNFRPQAEENKGASGHDSAGYRNAQEVSLVVYKDGDTIKATITRKIPLKGSITFDQQIVANRLQLELNGTASEVRVTEQRTDYEVLQQRVKPDDRLMSHHDYQSELAKPIFHVSRGTNMLLNLAKGTAVTGAVFGSTTGPDGATGSAMVFSLTSTISDTITTAITGDMTAMFFVTSVAGSMTLLTVGALTISLQVIGSTYFVVVDDGTSYVQGLSWTGTGWLALKISRSGSHWVISENGQNIITFLTAATVTLSGTVRVPAGASKNLFDVRVYDRMITAEANLYYYENVTLESGKAVLPIV